MVTAKNLSTIGNRTLFISRLPATFKVYPQRTNTILEQFFRGLRRDHRRCSGENSMHRALQTMLADNLLAKNLSNFDYMEVLLDGRQNLEALFFDLDITAVSSELVLSAENDRILPGFKAPVKMPGLPDRISRVALANPLG